MGLAILAYVQYTDLETEITPRRFDNHNLWIDGLFYYF